MARHAEILDSFKEKMENFDYSNEEHMTCVRGFLDYYFSVHSVNACRLKFVCLKPKIQYTLFFKKKSFLHSLPHLKELQFENALYKIDYSSFRNPEVPSGKKVYLLCQVTDSYGPLWWGKKYPQEYKL